MVPKGLLTKEGHLSFFRASKCSTYSGYSKCSKKQGSFINLTCVALSLPGLPIDVDWFHKDKVSYHLIEHDVLMFMIIEKIMRRKQ